jgi:hypothetical protein
MLNNKYIMMKYYNKIRTFAALLLIAGFISQFLVSCKKDDDSLGVPEIQYIRLNDPLKSDSLLVSASLGNVIVLMGKNLSDVKDIKFNDQKVKLNTSYITDRTIVLTIPTGIPTVVTDSITIVTRSGIRVQYPFKVLVPPAILSSLSNEYAQVGEDVTIKGNYLINDANVPLQVLFPGNIEGTVKSVSLTEVVVTVPQGAGVGPITVKTIYGSSRSSFYFHDDRNILLNFDDLTAVGGWRAGNTSTSIVPPISGNYVVFAGLMQGKKGAQWSEDGFSFNLWPQANGRANTPFTGDISDYQIKFECYVVNPWSAAAMQMIFTPYSTTGTNSYIGDTNVPRGLWIPWKETGSYKTSGWITVSIPLSDFKYTADGSACANAITKDMISGLTFFIYSGGVDGTDCNIQMCIDNIRVVPQ